MALLELRGVSKYFGGLAAVTDVDMDVEEGEIRGLIGPNGAGKTTLYNLITGFYPVTAGKIRYDGQDITGLPPHEIAKRGLVRTFQLTTLFMTFTVLESVMVACHLHSGIGFARRFLGTARDKERKNEAKSLEIINFLRLGHFRDELAMNLPHGYQRALGVTMALAAEPRILLLDEPVTGMNPTETQFMMDLIKKLRDRGITVFVVEHDMRAIMGLSDRITVLNFGKKIAEGTPQEISNNQDVIEAYLGSEEIVA